MTGTGLDIFDSAIERTTDWLRDLMRELNWTDYRKAYIALRFVLQGLRDHLPIDDAVNFGNQLPALIRGFYFEDWDVGGKPFPWNSRDDLLAGICTYFDPSDPSHTSPETIVRAVFRLLERKAAEGEIGNLDQFLSPELRELWPSTLRAA
jgi:uncharacterized protein (DUF2267 family)